MANRSETGGVVTLSPDRAAVAERNAFFEHSMDGLMVTAPDGRILDANPAACALLGYTVEQLRERGRQGVANPADARWVEAVRQRQKYGRVRAEASFLHADGSVVETEISSDVFEVDGELRTAVVIRDIGERLALEARLRSALAEQARLALTDELTGLPNRRAFFQAVGALLGGSSSRVHVLVADVDGLKAVNDELGHEHGNAMIAHVATVLESHFADVAVVARLGGDEFAVLVTGDETGDVARRTRSLPAALARHAARQGCPYPLLVSAGCAVGTPGTAEEFDRLLGRADAQMYRVKRRRSRARSASEAG